MKPTPQWGNIPAELQARRQWLLANKDAKGDFKVPTTLDAAGRLRMGNVIDPSCYLDFNVACSAAWHYGLAIGYVLHETDPYTCIDLDVKNASNEPDHTKWTTEAHMQRHAAIMQSFQSYTERSQSGQGFHIWVYANIGRGRNHDHVEVYSQERFIVCTGAAIVNLPITPYQEYTEMLVAEIDTRAPQKIELEEIDAVLTDREIYDKLAGAVNGEKFLTLYSGKTEGYKSQSEADLALLSMFTFHSKSNEQCRRMFRLTGLGQRAKATKNDVYLNRTLEIIRGRQAAELATEEHGEQIAAALLEAFKNKPQLPPRTAKVPDTATLIDWPPGVVGDIAKYIFESATRPVREVAIVSALGLFAGLTGKAWNIPQSGLNLYIILIARSAIGKETMHSGISQIMHQLMSYHAIGAKITEFVDFSDYASGPALAKGVATNPSFVNVAGEWGKKLKRLASEEGRDGPMTSLRTVMTNLYQKSASTSIVGGIGYSDKLKNVASVAGVAYSMIGETTPGTFYESLTESMMEDGFLSRFTIIEHKGERPAQNMHQRTQLTVEEKNKLMGVIHFAVEAKSRSFVYPVGLSEGARQIISAFDKECDMQINSTDEESWRQMWNRAHLKVCRIAAVLAAADNPAGAVMQVEHVEWALDVVRRDITVMSRRITSGDVGTNDDAREKKLLDCISKYLQGDIPPTYNVTPKLAEFGIVPRKYMQIKLQKSPAFATHRNGSTRALDETIRSLIDSGYLIEITKDKLVSDFGFHGRAFRILDLQK